jgi:hypothetical protein
MIKANELRIGNWVNIGDLSTTINHIMGDEDYFQPIPLTPEILEKCGFEKVETMGLMEVYQYAGDGLEISIENDFYYCNGGYTCDVRLTSLHQLQKLYYAVTGEELTITL